ncbi:MBL fold metallo-hydrolase [Candidatus Dojkabacteria bacterium]|nr:MBL fold metallo-hydrolase [Candidatus Dojkabacteria bacterium]
MSCFKIKNGNSTIVTDPYDSDEVGLSINGLDSDSILLSKDLSLYSKTALDNILPSESRAESKQDIVNIFEPGEYEVAGFFVRYYDLGYSVISVDDVNICYLGLSDKLASAYDFSDLPRIDYLIVPVGNNAMFPDFDNVESLIKDADAAVVIPSCYRLDGMKGNFADLKSVDEFLSEMGESGVKREKKLELMPQSLGEEQKYKIVVMEQV